MTPGPDVIVSCPACGELAKYQTMLSGNNIGAVLWTDGFLYEPMMIRPPLIVQCHSCQKVFWLQKAEVVGECRGRGGMFWSGLSDDEKEPEEWAESPYLKLPEEMDFYEAIEAGLAEDHKEETWARISAWWQSNDLCRKRNDRLDDPIEMIFPYHEARTTNMEKLLDALTRKNTENPIMICELYRELGEFEKSREAMSRINQADYRAEIERMDFLSKNEDQIVRILREGY